MKAFLALGAVVVLLGAGCTTTVQRTAEHRRSSVDSWGRICAPSSSRARRRKRACAT